MNAYGSTFRIPQLFPPNFHCLCIHCLSPYIFIILDVAIVSEGCLVWTETGVYSSTAGFLSLVDPTLQLDDKLDSDIQGYSQDIKAGGIGSFDGQSEWFETIQSNMDTAAGLICSGKNDQHCLLPPYFAKTDVAI